ncbi:MAG: ABC transporter substrate-binding protein [Pigmentiphaga sp.]|uniref:ABC transporter substrate-binding protein n=1 Tax=Pigmentiphaga sp. TaxID=1977564 RepID=UPI0029A4F3C2|nr:ABC transporter substrate-binding protein [Pigmentiphaga sp.]MDX3904843.1 ABC transporter substrate-binding protein [Pigmentiphaga sp.]
MIRTFKYLLAALVACSSATAQGDTLDDIKTKGVVVVANGGAYPPFGFVENGKMVGFDIDLGNEVAKRLGVQAKWEKIDFSGLLPALSSKRVDMLITAMTWTPERAQRITFSTPYYNSGIAGAYKPGNPVKTPADLAGKTVAVQIGSAGERFVRELGTAKQVKTYNDFLLAFADVEAGRADVVVNTLPVVRYNALRRTSGLEVSPTWDKRDVGINTRMEDQRLLQAINAVLADLEREGFLKQLDDKWFR